MSTHYVPSAQEFRAGAAEHYSFLLQRYTFSLQERLADDQDFVVRFCGDRLNIVVEGMSYGFALGTRIERHSAGSVAPEVIHLHSLIELRRPELLASRYPDQRGQLEDMKFDSRALSDLASDLLSGDLSDWSRLYSAAKANDERQKLEADDRMRRHDIDRASARAAEAFRKGEFRKVVEILSPLEAELSPGQVTKLKLAKKRAGDAA